MTDGSEALWPVAPSASCKEAVSELWTHLGFPPPPIEFVTPNFMPDQYRMLLVHREGMTATLERHWHEPITIELLADDISLEHRSLFRFVVLRTEHSRTAVELAMIRIPMDVFSSKLRHAFIWANRPFGSLLTEAGIAFRASPKAFFTLEADQLVAENTAVAVGTPLYGRINHLLRDDGVLLCETAEILPRA
jgi:hypothetical protein